MPSVPAANCTRKGIFGNGEICRLLERCVYGGCKIQKARGRCVGLGVAKLPRSTCHREEALHGLAIFPTPPSKTLLRHPSLAHHTDTACRATALPCTEPFCILLLPPHAQGSTGHPASSRSSRGLRGLVFCGPSLGVYKIKLLPPDTCSPTLNPPGLTLLSPSLGLSPFRPFVYRPFAPLERRVGTCIWRERGASSSVRRRRRRRRSLLRIVHARGEIPNEMGSARCRATPALNQPEEGERR